MGFGEPFGSPFYSGGGASVLVPDRFDAAIAGLPFMLDPTEDNAGWWTGDIPVQRAQADTEADPSEATINTEGLWRRTRQAWYLGSGQKYADRPTSSPLRYAESTGIDPWDRDFPLRLLSDTVESLSSANTALYFALADDRLYVTDGQVVRYTTDLATWTAITGNPAATALSIASDGATVYVAYGASGVYSIASGAGAMAVHSTGTASAVAYVKGRLMVVETSTATPRVYNVTASGGAVTAGNLVLTAPSGATFEGGQWAAETPGAIVLAANTGDVRPRLWRTSVKPDGTALDVAIPAGELPDGQVLRSVQGYLGSVVTVGTDDKVWLMAPDDAGNLSILGSVDTVTPCLAFEPQDRFVWYGHDEGTLGRLDLRTNVAENPGDLIPAHATDLTAGVTGDVRSITTFLGRRVFTVEAEGVYAEDPDTTVAEGVIDLGVINFGIGDLKNALYADVRHLPLAAGDSVALEVAADDGPWQAVGASDAVGAVSKTLGLGQVVAETLALRLTLAGDPTVTMVTIRAVPAPKVGERTRLRVRCFRDMVDASGQPVLADNTVVLDAPSFLAFVRNLRERRSAVIIQLGSESFVGIIDGLVRFTPHSKAPGDNGTWLGWWNGTSDIDVIRVEA